MFTPEKLKSSTEKVTPSGKYKLTIETYSTQKDCWDYTKGIVRTNEGKIVAEIERNYCNFNHSFFIKDGNEWMVTGKSYISQTFVNLETGEIFDYNLLPFDYCLAKVYANKDSTILAFVGCAWGFPYTYDFFDFSDTSVPPKKLNCNVFFDSYECELDPVWTDDNVFICFKTVDSVEIDGKYISISDADIEKLPHDDNLYAIVPTGFMAFKRKGDDMVLILESK